jgi:alpha-1,3-rhamnosyl/mannosyltransferase
VGLDYRPALANREGIGRYTRELVRAIIELGADEPLRLFSTTLAASRFTRAELGLEKTRARTLRLRLPSRALAPLMRFSRRGADDWLGGVEVFHHTQPNLLWVRKAAEIATVFDCIWLEREGWLEEGSAQRMERVVRSQVERARLVLVPTAFVAEDVIARLGVARERVLVTELGCDHALNTLPQGALSPRSTPGYLLSVSRIDARKNHVRMLAAFEQLVAEGFTQRWIVAGPRGFGFEAFAAAFERSSARARIDWREFVDEAELARLYAGADAFLFASLSEGFGLPPLEAMLHGVPVIAARAASLPEVCGDAAVLVDPLQVDAIADGLRRVLADADFSADLVRKGRAQAARFTWKACAEKTLAAYARAARN